MEMESYKEITERLEHEELKSQLNNVQFYLDLHAHYILQNMLVEANLLWKRIPSHMKTESAELQKLHILTKCLQFNNYERFFKEIDYNWSNNIKPLMMHLLQNVMNSVLNMIGNAYVSIFEINLCKMLNMSKQQLEETYKRLGWTVDNSNQDTIIIPKRPINTDNVTCSSEYQLSKLTELVSFLEN